MHQGGENSLIKGNMGVSAWRHGNNVCASFPKKKEKGQFRSGEKDTKNLTHATKKGRRNGQKPT